jgi:hypothetical protein
MNSTAQDQGLVSDEHFSVDGTLIEAWAAMKSCRRKVPELTRACRPFGRLLIA